MQHTTRYVSTISTDQPPTELIRIHRTELLQLQKQLIIQSDHMTTDQLYVIWHQYNQLQLNDARYSDLSYIILPNINSTHERLHFILTIVKQILNEQIHQIYNYTINQVLLRLENKQLYDECNDVFTLYCNTTYQQQSRKSQPNTHTLGIILSIYKRNQMNYSVETILRIMDKYNLYNSVNIDVYNHLLQQCIHTQQYQLGCTIYERFIVSRINQQHRESVEYESMDQNEIMLQAYYKDLLAAQPHNNNDDPIDISDYDKIDLSSYQHINKHQQFTIDHYTVDAVMLLYTLNKQYKTVLKLYDQLYLVMQQHKHTANTLHHSNTYDGTDAIPLLTVISYQQAIVACIQLDNNKKIGHIFKQMSDNNIQPDLKLFTSIITAYLQHNNINAVQSMLVLMNKYGVQPDYVLSIQLIYYYHKQQQYHDVCRLYDELVGSNQLTNKLSNITYAFYNTIINSYIHCKQYDTAKQLLQHLVDSPDEYDIDGTTFSLLIQSYSQQNETIHCAYIIGLKRKYAVDYDELNLLPDADDYLQLIQCLIRNHKYQQVYSTYNAYCNDIRSYKQSGQDRSNSNKQPKYDELAIYHAVIQVCTVLKDTTKAFSILDDILLHGYIQPIDYTYNEVIKCCIRCNEWSTIKDVINRMKSNHVKPNQWTLLLVQNVRSDHVLYRQCVDYVSNYVNDTIGISNNMKLNNNKQQGRPPRNKLSTYKVSSLVPQV